MTDLLGRRYKRGSRCLGAPAFGAVGCGGKREERPLTGDARLRWCCARCAERIAAREGVAGPRQLSLGVG